MGPSIGAPFADGGLDVSLLLPLLGVCCFPVIVWLRWLAPPAAIWETREMRLLDLLPSSGFSNQIAIRRCDIKGESRGHTPIKSPGFKYSKLALTRDEPSPPSVAVSPSSHGRHHQCVPRTSTRALLSSPRTPHRSSPRLPQASTPSVRPQVFLRVLVDRRRLGYPRSLPTDLEAPSHQGMARAQNHLPLYQGLHANCFHCRRFVPARALPAYQQSVLSPIFSQRCSSSTQNGPKRCVVCAEFVSSPHLTPTPGP